MGIKLHLGLFPFAIGHARSGSDSFPRMSGSEVDLLTLGPSCNKNETNFVNKIFI